MELIKNNESGKTNENSGLYSFNAKTVDEAHEFMRDKLIKVNLPLDKEGLTTHTGEGIWAFVLTAESMQKYQDNEVDTVIEVMASNQAIGLTPIGIGTVIEVKLNGNQRPYLHAEWLSGLIEEKIGLTLEQLME